MLALLTTEGTRMLCDSTPARLSDFDQQVFRLVVPPDHYRRKVLQVVPWDDFHEILAPYYNRDLGRPAESPVLMLKLEYLRYHHNLSDREVIARAETDVPPSTEPDTGLYKPQDFVQDPMSGSVTCPAGHTSQHQYYDPRKRATTHQFAAETCRACPLLACCMKRPPQKDVGRTVRKSDYQAEHQRARDKAATPAYAATRREHPKIERKLGEVMNRQGGRRARYRGRWKVLLQELMACTATNVKRLARLVCAPDAGIICEG